MSEKKGYWIPVTQMPGQRLNQNETIRLYSRYCFSKSFVKAKDVLEVACGPGMGLGYIAETARTVVATDIEDVHIEIARKLYKDRDNIDVMKRDAKDLSFSDKSFDVILLLEAIYYLKHPEIFLKNAYRLLRKGGILLLSTYNKDFKLGFSGSPPEYIHEYLAVPDLYNAIRAIFSKVQMFGCMPEMEGERERKDSLSNSQLRKLARALLSKKIRKQVSGFFSEKALPGMIYDGMAPYQEPVPIPTMNPNSDFRDIYAVATK